MLLALPFGAATGVALGMLVIVGASALAGAARHGIERHVCWQGPNGRGSKPLWPVRSTRGSNPLPSACLAFVSWNRRIAP